VELRKPRVKIYNQSADAAIKSCPLSLSSAFLVDLVQQICTAGNDKIAENTDRLYRRKCEKHT
jgi:hypothetical protein